MKTSTKVILAVILTFAITFAGTVAIFTGSQLSGFGFNYNSSYYDGDGIDAKLAEITALIDNHAIKDFDRDMALKNAVYFYVLSLDDMYCSYFDQSDYVTYLDQTSGGFTGIGINVAATAEILEDGLLIYRVLGNSPAEKAGILGGDVIIEADGFSFIDALYDDAVDVLLGEEGTSVSIKVRRGEDIFDFTVVRQSFTQRLVDYYIIDSVGFVRIHEFDEAAYPQFADALADLLTSGVKGFIFDVRNNPGGELNTVKNMIDLLVPKDELVVLQYKNNEQVYNSTDSVLTDLPCVVLQNSSSASGSELFASALRDIRGVQIIGTQSYGKGVGQTSFQLSDGSAVKLTTFYYVTKSRYNYDGIGLEPDYVVEPTEEQNLHFYTVKDEDDPQLQKALQVLMEQISQ